MNLFLRWVCYACVLIACTAAGTACSTREESATERAKKQIAELEERARKIENAAKEADKRDHPFNSSLHIDSLSSDDKKRLCGSDYGAVAVGWPIKKALVCTGRDLYVVSESAGSIRIWQHCYSGGGCLTGC